MTAATNFQSRMSAHVSLVHLNHFAIDVTYIQHDGTETTLKAVVILGDDTTLQNYDDMTANLDEIEIYMGTDVIDDPRPEDQFKPLTGPAANKVYQVQGNPVNDGHGMQRVRGMIVNDDEIHDGNFRSVER